MMYIQMPGVLHTENSTPAGRPSRTGQAHVRVPVNVIPGGGEHGDPRTEIRARK